CLYLAHECPHYPYQGPADPAYRSPGHPEPIKGPRQDSAAAYREMMEHMDAGVGRIREVVREEGLERDTLIVFFSDNGPDGPGSAGPLRGGKGSLWEGGHRVPAAACWPGSIPAGGVVDATCMGMDLLPTMLALAGVSCPSGLQLDGVDLSPVLRGTGELPGRRLFWRHAGTRAVRDGDWKLHLDRDDVATLYHLASDRGELRDRSADHPALVAELRAALRAWEADVDRSG
ncbi:MAG: sulfatase, partial [Planctomycetota bacterium]